MKRKCIVALVMAAILLAGAGLASAQTSCPPYVADLTAGYGKTGPGIKVGTVTVWNDATNLYVEYATTGGWVLNSTHVGICTTAFPSGGRPVPGQSPYMTDPHPAGTTSYLYTIPLLGMQLHPDCPECASGTCTIDAVCEQTLHIAAHAAVSNPATGQSETAYGGTCFGASGGSWFCQIAYTICCGITPPPPSACDETAWAKGGADQATCLLSIAALKTDKWGWTNGPLGVGTYNFELWAGAGQCDTSKGTLVGMVTVAYNGASATVTYNVFGTNPVTGADYKLDEVHLWAGATQLPMQVKKTKTGVIYVPTAAPGLFPYLPVISADGKSATYTVNGLSNGIYVAAHAVVNGFPCPPPPVPAP